MSDWNCTHKKGTGMVQVTTFSASTDPVPLNTTPRLAASSQFGPASLQVIYGNLTLSAIVEFPAIHL
jgi:hypothetical protein